MKNALFYVLLGARMPAVLVETGFISNRAEEKRLASERYQDEVASGIARAVAHLLRRRGRAGGQAVSRAVSRLRRPLPELLQDGRATPRPRPARAWQLSQSCVMVLAGLGDVLVVVAAPAAGGLLVARSLDG